MTAIERLSLLDSFLENRKKESAILMALFDTFLMHVLLIKNILII